MPSEPEPARSASHVVRELLTFRVGDVLAGVDVQSVRELDRVSDEITPAPKSPDSVLGVIHLRGEVVTVLDLRRVLALEPCEPTRRRRTVVVECRGERVAFVVDSISDVVRCRADEIEPPPGNVFGVAGECFHGILKLDHGIVAILNIESTLQPESPISG